MAASLSSAPHPRAGLVVAKHGHSSVERNRLKRRLREIARTQLLPGAAPVDIVITTRSSAYALTFAQLGELGERIRRELDRLAPTLRPPAGPAVPS